MKDIRLSFYFLFIKYVLHSTLQRSMPSLSVQDNKFLSLYQISRLQIFKKYLNIKLQCPRSIHIPNFKNVDIQVSEKTFIIILPYPISYPYTKFQDYRFSRLNFKKSSNITPQRQRAYFKKSIDIKLQCPIAFKKQLNITLQCPKAYRYTKFQDYRFCSLVQQFVRGSILLPNFNKTDLVICCCSSDIKKSLNITLQ